MTPIQHTITLSSAQDTTDLATQIGRGLSAGDCLLLEGGIGAGKTHFARSLIQSLLEFPEDVPSPTFTLIQIYDTTKGELWHADLYRLGSVDDVVELGLDDAMSSAICLIEWPDRLAELTPEHALTLSFSLDETLADTRYLKFAWTDQKWSNLLELT